MAKVVLSREFPYMLQCTGSEWSALMNATRVRYIYLWSRRLLTLHPAEQSELKHLGHILQAMGYNFQHLDKEAKEMGMNSEDES